MCRRDSGPRSVWLKGCFAIHKPEAQARLLGQSRRATAANRWHVDPSRLKSRSGQIVEDARGLVGFHTHENQIGPRRTPGARIDLNARHVDVADQRRPNVETMAAHRLELRAASDEVHVAAGVHQ